MPKLKEKAGIRGFFRLNIVNPDGSIAGDSGWLENQITNDGFNNFMAKALGAISGSSQIGYVALGTGTVPGAAATTLDGEIMSSTKRTAVSAATSSNSKAVQFTAAFATVASFLTAQATLQNVGLFATTNTNATLFAGNTYTTSACATNQAVNVTYTINFNTA